MNMSIALDAHLGHVFFPRAGFSRKEFFFFRNIQTRLCNWEKTKIVRGLFKKEGKEKELLCFQWIMGWFSSTRNSVDRQHRIIVEDCLFY